RRTIALFISALAATLCSSLCFGVTQSQVFTYQGRLTENDAPVNGTVSLTCKLFDALSGGTQKGSTQIVVSQPVNDGLFPVNLNFGSSAYDGRARWLEISVNGNILTPRQPLTSAPFAISLAPGAVIEGESSVSQSLIVRNSLAFAGSSAVYGLHGL